MDPRRRLVSRTALALVLLVTCAGALLADRLLGGIRIDLTDRGLYTLSDGTRRLLAELRAPVTLELYFSRSLASGRPELTDHARNVERMLRNFARASDGRVRVRVIEPEPFSPEADAALAAGLQAVPMAGGEELQLGIVGRRVDDDRASTRVIPFLHPDRQRFLEYEIARLVDELARDRVPRVALISGLPMTSRGSSPPAFLEQLESRFELIRSELDAGDELTETDVLILIHPRHLSVAARYAIDQYVLAGGPAVVFVDPHAELDRAPDDEPFPSPGRPRTSDPGSLLEAWGIDWPRDRVVLDAGAALGVEISPGAPPRAHLAMPGYDRTALDTDDVVMARLERINLSTAGVLHPRPGADTRFEPLIRSSPDSALVDVTRVRGLTDPTDLSRDFRPDGVRHVLAARVRGPARTAFPDPGSDDAPGTRHRESGEIHVLVVADTDLLADRLWVRVEDFFDRTLVTPWASNGDLVINAVDHLAGSEALLEIRGGPGFERPFERVEAIRRAAEAQLAERIRSLEEQLAATEQGLETLRDRTADAATDPELAATLARHREQRLQLRTELRAARHRLTAEVDALGMRLKLIAIVLVPALVALVGILTAWRRLRPRPPIREGATHHDH
jgi:ABC-type uncharacterized transport system involved in gliding motility auxiliary subunit